MRTERISRLFTEEQACDLLATAAKEGVHWEMLDLVDPTERETRSRDLMATIAYFFTSVPTKEVEDRFCLKGGSIESVAEETLKKILRFWLFNEQN